VTQETEDGEGRKHSRSRVSESRGLGWTSGFTNKDGHGMYLNWEDQKKNR
jgi:hypothetical protein